MAIIPFLDIDGAALVYQLAGNVPVTSIDLCDRSSISIVGDRADSDAARAATVLSCQWTVAAAQSPIAKIQIRARIVIVASD